MKYTNCKIKKLIEERDLIIRKFNEEIDNEIQKEKANYNFKWDRFSLMIIAIVVLVIAVEVNEKLFPKTSIWSWDYYFNK